MAKLPKSIIKKYGITKKAWAVFRGRSKSRRKSKTKTNPKKVSRMVRRRWGRRGRRRGGKSMTRTAFKLVRLGALAGPGIYHATAPIHPDMSARAHAILEVYTGYNMKDGRWSWGSLLQGWGPYLGACVATYGIPKLISIIRRL